MLYEEAKLFAAERISFHIRQEVADLNTLDMPIMVKVLQGATNTHR